MAGMRAQFELERKIADAMTASYAGYHQAADLRERLVELSHEALIRGWSRLKGWIDEAGNDLVIRARLDEEASNWVQHRRDPSFLYPGTRLAQARKWKEEHPEDVNPLEKEFVQASEAAAAWKRFRTRGIALAAFLVTVIFLVLTTAKWLEAENANVLLADKNKEVEDKNKEVEDKNKEN